MKKLFATLLAVLMVLTLAGCGSNETTSQTDSEYVKEKGTLVVGITNFEPMDYPDENGEWIGFDADMAKTFGESLGVDVEFVEIDWDNKVVELNSKSIDCIWNGMTLTSEITSSCATSNAYANNAQVIVCNKDMADKFADADSIEDAKTIAVEAGSAADEILTDAGYEDKLNRVDTQAKALTEVKSGNSEICVIDNMMAGAMVGEGTSFESLTYTAGLNSEEYGVAFREGSDLADALNEFFAASYEDGTMLEVAETYGVQAMIIAQ